MFHVFININEKVLLFEYDINKLSQKYTVNIHVLIHISKTLYFVIYKYAVFRLFLKQNGSRFIR